MTTLNSNYTDTRVVYVQGNAYTADPSDVIMLTNNVATTTITLPTTGMATGQFMIVKNIGGNANVVVQTDNPTSVGIDLKASVNVAAFTGNVTSNVVTTSSTLSGARFMWDSKQYWQV